MNLPIEQTWLILVDLLTALKKKGVVISTTLNRDLGLVKSSISFYLRDPSHPDMIKEFDRANITITEIQDNLLELASRFGDDFYNQWIDKLKRANLGEELYSKPAHNSRFQTNAPPGLSIAKIHLQNPISEDRIQEIAEHENLILEFEDDSTIAIYGDEHNVKMGLKELASFFNE
ncbi:MAG: DUF2096 domain-containing protein [Methanobrevibacter sp.]|jgi:hypothetical protein|nr:DUF2096 domain-containing protein [Candidatus Methanovirga basalitermitum]